MCFFRFDNFHIRWSIPWLPRFFRFSNNCKVLFYSVSSTFRFEAYAYVLVRRWSLERISYHFSYNYRFHGFNLCLVLSTRNRPTKSRKNRLLFRWHCDWNHSKIFYIRREKIGTKNNQQKQAYNNPLRCCPHPWGSGVCCAVQCNPGSCRIGWFYSRGLQLNRNVCL